MPDEDNSGAVKRMSLMEGEVLQRYVDTASAAKLKELPALRTE